MALIDPTKYTRLDVPGEDAWVEIRPKMVGDLLNAAQQESDSTFVVLSRRIRAWSYDEAVSPESVAHLDIATFNLLSGFGERPAGETRNLGQQSSPTSDPAAADGPENSAT